MSEMFYIDWWCTVENQRANGIVMQHASAFDINHGSVYEFSLTSQSSRAGFWIAVFHSFGDFTYSFKKKQNWQIRQHSHITAIWHLITQLLIRGSLCVCPEFTLSHSYNYLVLVFDSVLFNLATVGIPHALHQLTEELVAVLFWVILQKTWHYLISSGLTGFFS